MQFVKACISIFSLLAFILTASSCTKDPPRIDQEHHELILFKDAETNRIFHKLSLFVLASDPDGSDDIGTIYLINDEKNLYWEMDQSTYSKQSMNNQTWIGLNAITMNESSLFPKGEYRILVNDLGGESSERQITVDYKEFDRNKAGFPRALIEKDDLVITGSTTNAYIVWVYDFSGAFIDIIHYTGKKISASAIASKNQKTASGFTYYVYTFDSSLAMGLVSGPYHYSKP